MSQDRSRRFFSLVVLLAMLTTLVAGCAQPIPMAPAAAPAADSGAEAGGEAAAAASGEIVPGGTWTEASNADASNFNPILYDDTASFAVVQLLYPSLIGQDPETGEFTPEGSMSESWSVSEDGLAWTFKLRDGITWSDGDLVDSADFKYTYDAIIAENVQSPRTYVWEGIESIEAPDPKTVVVKFEQVKCDALGNLGLGWLPSHLYAPDFSDVMTGSEGEAPRVSAGPLMFQSWTRDDNIILVRNEDYWESSPQMDGMIIRVVPDAGARLAQLQSGEIDYLEGTQPNQIASAEQDPDLARFRYYDDGYHYLKLNYANPANPQNGRDEDGNLIAQDPHPILGDVRVRQAIAHAIDYQSIIDNILLGQGYPMAANVLPVIEWAVNPDIEPYAYDLELASSILEEAGWVDSDGDGIREKDGMDMTVRLITNAGNTTREDIGVYIQDQLSQIGINVDFQAIDFGTMLDQMDAQTYDMVVGGWTGIGADPNDNVFWSSEFDVVGSGFNDTSYQNPRVEELLVQGYSAPGCNPDDRAPIYHEIQQIIHDELPYIFLAGRVANDFYNKDWTNIDPGTWNFKWNMHNWYKQSLQPAATP